MRQLLSTLSIKSQVFVPVLFTVILLIVGLSIGIGKLEQAFDKVTVSTNNLIVHKEELSSIVDNTYAMRIKAIYSLFRLKMSKHLTNNYNNVRQPTENFSTPSIKLKAFKLKLTPCATP